MDRKHLLKLLKDYRTTGDSTPIEALFEEFQKESTRPGAVQSPENAQADAPTSEPQDAAEEGLAGGTIRMPVDNRAAQAPEGIASFGEYERQSRLGQGGMGSVWKVVDHTLKRYIAMKIMHPKFSLNAVEQENFIEEAQINAQLQHPGIVPVYELGRMEDKRLYFTMREIQGRTLKDVIQEVHEASYDGVWRPAKGGWTLRRILSAFHNVCETISYAHNRGVIHQDIKPSNIMIGDFGEVLVLDWGVAKIIGNQGDFGVETERSKRGINPHEGMIVGTPVYMSPEQARGESQQVDIRSDIYSLGATLYQILCGKNPYQGSIQSIIEKKVTSASPPISDYHVERLDEDPIPSLRDIQHLSIPKDLIVICEKAMQPHPENRHQTVQEFAVEIQRWLEGAERREKALARLTQTQEIVEKVKDLEEKAQENWTRANQLFQNNTLESPEAWRHLETTHRLQSQADECNTEIEQLLQSALLYDPEMQETHRRLMEIEYRKYMSAARDADKLQVDQFARKIRMHLDMLPEEEAKHWREKRIVDTRSILLERKLRGDMIGRTEQLSHIIDMLHKHNAVCLFGTNGIGKTHLALEAASRWRVQEEYTTLFCSMRYASTQLEIVQVLCKALQIQVSSQNPVHHLGMEIEKTKELLLVLDDVEAIQQQIGQLVEGWRENNPNLKIIFTSQTNMPMFSDADMEIPKMSLLESMELFIAKTRGSSKRLTPYNCINIGSLVQTLNGIPSAIELVATHTAKMSVEEMKRRIDNRFQSLPDTKRDYSSVLQLALDWSLEQLSEWEVSALIQCNVFQNGFDREAAERVVDISFWDEAPDIHQVLKRLCKHNFIYQERQDDGTVRYDLLAFIQNHISNRLSENLSQNRWFYRASLRHAKYFSTLYTQSLHPTSMEIMQMVSKERENFQVATDRGAPEEAYFCIIALKEYFQLHGLTDSCIARLQTFLERESLSNEMRISIQLSLSSLRMQQGKQDLAQRALQTALELTKSASKPTNTNKISIDFDPPLDNQEAQEIDATTSAFAKKMLNATDKLTDSAEKETLYFQALETYRAACDEAGMGEVSLLLGRFYTRLQSPKSIEYLKKAVVHFRRIDDRKKQNLALFLISNIQKVAGKYEQALEILQAIKDYSVGLNDQNRSFSAHLNMGNIFLEQGLYEKAMDNYKRALLLTDNQQRRSICIGNMGLVFTAQGELSTALECYEKSIEISVEGSDQRPHFAIVLGNTGDVYLRLRELEKAEEYLIKSCQLSNGKHPIVQAAFSGSLALVFAYQGRFEEAFDQLEQCEEFLVVRPEEYIKFICKKGEVQLLAQQKEEAISSLRHAQRLVKQLKVTKESEQIRYIDALKSKLFHRHIWEYQKPEEILKADILIQQTSMSIKEERYEEGLGYCAEAFSVYQAMQHRPGLMISFARYGTIYHKLDRYTAALEAYHKAQEIAEELKDAAIKGECFIGMGNVYETQGDRHKAIEQFKKVVHHAQKRGNKHQEGMYLERIGHLYNEIGDQPESIASYQRAIDCFIHIGQEYMGHRCLANLGRMHQENQKYHRALEVYDDALQGALEIQDQRHVAQLYYQIGSLHRDLENTQLALQAYQKIFALEEVLDDANLVAQTYGHIGLLRRTLQQSKSAKSALQSSIRLFQEYPHPDKPLFGIALAQLHLNDGETDEALRLLEDFDDPLDKYPMQQIVYLCERGHIMLRLKRIVEAGQCLDKAQKCAQGTKFSPATQQNLEKKLQHLHRSITQNPD